MLKPLFNNLSDKEKDDAIESIIQHATPRTDFFLMMTLSVSMAAFAVILDSVVILIASMLIAPLLFPLLSLALGITASDEKLIGRSMRTLLKSILVALAACFVIGLLFAPRGIYIGYPIGIVEGAPSSLMYAIVAAIAGFAAAFAVTKPHLNESLPGVAIAVTLVPPLAVMGIGLSLFNAELITNALSLFLVNIIGILFSAMIVFSLLRFSAKSKVTEEVVKQENKVVEKEADLSEEKE